MGTKHLTTAPADDLITKVNLLLMKHLPSAPIMPSAKRVGHLLLLLSFPVASAAFGNVLSLFPIGDDAKSAAIESAIDSRQPQGLLYNPAGLALSKPGFQGEFGVGRLLYSYEHPSYDPVRVSLFSPIVSAGWRSDCDGGIQWGLALAPTAMNQLKIKGLPRRVAGKLDSLNVDTNRQQFHLPMGASYSFNSDPRTSLGVSLITTYDSRSLKADSLVDGSHLVDMNSRGTFFRPEMGGMFGHGPVDIGLSYMGAATKHYKGTTSLASELTGPFDTEQVEYDPAVIATGVRGTYENWNASININRVLGAGGANVIRDGINRKTTAADVRDVNQYGMRVGYTVDKFNAISAAYSYLPTIWGAGSFSIDSDGFAHAELGHLFGTFNAMPVRNQALAWKYHGDSLDFHSSLFRTAGKQSVDLGGDNPGYYQIEFVALSTGISKSF